MSCLKTLKYLYIIILIFYIILSGEIYIEPQGLFKKSGIRCVGAVQRKRNIIFVQR